MTTICGGGSSTFNTGVNTSIFIDQQYIQSLLPPVLAWLYPFLPFMHGLQIGDVPTFCSTDPPLVPALPSASDFLSFITGGNIASFINVNQFLQDITQTYIWYQICHCTVGSPSSYTPPSNPGNLPAVNPPTLVTPPGCAPCFSITSPVLTMTHVHAGPPTGYSDPPFPPYTAGVGPSMLFPPNPSYLEFVLTVTPAGVTHDNYEVVLDLQDPQGTFGSFIVTPSGGYSSGTHSAASSNTWPGGARPYGWNVIEIRDFSTGVQGSDQVQLTANVYCNGCKPGAAQVACCPPDPQMMGLLTQLATAVTLIQRQLAPFGYIASTVHSGLTGNGSFSVSDLLGMKASITAGSSLIGTTSGTPPELFDAGFISFGTSDGYSKSFRIDHNPTLMFPEDCGLYTLIGYTIPVGLTVSLTELVREP